MALWLLLFCNGLAPSNHAVPDLPTAHAPSAPAGHEHLPRRLCAGLCGACHAGGPHSQQVAHVVGRVAGTQVGQEVSHELHGQLHQRLAVGQGAVQLQGRGRAARRALGCQALADGEAALHHALRTSEDVLHRGKRVGQVVPHVRPPVAVLWNGQPAGTSSWFGLQRCLFC